MSTVSDVHHQQPAFVRALVALPDLKDPRHDPVSIRHLIHCPTRPQQMTSPLRDPAHLRLLYLHPFPDQLHPPLAISLRFMHESIV